MKKQFYIFLCMLLGIALLLVIQRALAVIYFVLANNNPAIDILTPVQLQWADWGTAALAAIFGLFYGLYLGRHWYPLVYGEDGFVTKKVARTLQSKQKTVMVKAPQSTKTMVSMKTETKSEGWDFDDLIKYDAPSVDGLEMGSPGIMSSVSLSEPTPKPVKRTIKKVAVTAKSKPKTRTRSVAKTETAVKVNAIRKPANKTKRAVVKKVVPARTTV